MTNGLYAKFNTTKGDIIVNLEFEKTPGTVGNFVALTEGNLENTARPQGKPYYDGLKFHKVIADFMVQGGCQWELEQAIQVIVLMMSFILN